MMPYERLTAWKKCHELALAVYDASDSFPKNEEYGLKSQARRAAFSAPANLAEGSARRGPGEFRRFIDFAIGSLAELSYTLRFVRDRRIVDDARWRHLENLREEASKTTWGLYVAIRDSASRRKKSQRK